MKNQRSVAIFGASSDIGLATCQKYLSSGWEVLAYSKIASGSVGANNKICCFDLSEERSVELGISLYKTQLERVDALVWLPALSLLESYADTSIESFQQVLFTNYLSYFRISQIVIPRMLERSFGRIVLGGSIGVKFGGSRSSFAYSASKWLLEFMPMESKMWARNDVFINTVRIGVTDTKGLRDSGKDLVLRQNQIPVGRMAQPEEIAAFIYSIGSDENSFITRQVISMSGGE